MNKQFYEELLAKFQKANKTRKLYLANKAGYETIEDYKKALELSISEFVEPEIIKEEKSDSVVESGDSELIGAYKTMSTLL